MKKDKENNIIYLDIEDLNRVNNNDSSFKNYNLNNYYDCQKLVGKVIINKKYEVCSQILSVNNINDTIPELGLRKGINFLIPVAEGIPQYVTPLELMTEWELYKGEED